MMIKIFSAAVFAATVILCAPQQGWCGEGGEDTKERSKDYFDRGVMLFQAGDYKGALENFVDSYNLRPHVNVKFNIGVCLFQLGKYAESGNALAAFLVIGGENAPEAKVKRAKELLGKIEKKTGKIDVKVDMEGAQVSIDGAVVGVSPLSGPVYIEPGSHRMKVYAKEGQEWSGEVVVEAGEVEAISVNIVKVEAAGPEVEAAGPEKMKHAASQSVQKDKSGRALFYVSLGLALAAAIGGGASGGVALKKTSELDDLDAECETSKCMDDFGRHEEYLGDWEDLNGERESAGKWSTGLFISAGALAVMGLVVLLVARPFRKERKGDKGGNLVPSFIVGGETWKLGVSF